MEGNQSLRRRHGFGVAWCLLWVLSKTAHARAPNILVMLVDDMGYSDLSLYGSPNVTTPHIDALMNSGMRFTHWVSAAPICTPSRAAIQTGNYPIRTGCIGNVERYRVLPTPANPGGLDPSTQTSLAVALKQAGYAHTGYSGKWHLGINGNRPLEKPDHRFAPNAHGYDTYVGAPWTNAPMCEMDGDGVSHKFKSGPKFCFLTANNTVIQQPLHLVNFTKTITDFTVSFLERRGAEGADAPPWFFFHSWFHVHSPLFTSTQNRGRSQGGRFGDNVEELDDSVGRIMSALRDNSLSNNTLIMFTSDNGPYAEEGYDAAGRTNLYNDDGDLAGRLKGSKGQIWEGGLRVPGAVVWPGVVLPGSVSDTLVSSMDIFATAMAAAGGITSATDGKSMLPVATGATNSSQHDVLLHFCGFQPTAARVQGRWKLHWALQRWYTKDAMNASICLQCCNGVNPWSRLYAPATQLCGCENADLIWLVEPVVFDMLHDRGELEQLTDANWPDNAPLSYADVVAAANATRDRVVAEAGHPHPDRNGAGTCTHGYPAGSRQPCCPGCSAHTLLGTCVDKHLRPCSCDAVSDIVH